MMRSLGVALVMVSAAFLAGCSGDAKETGAVGEPDFEFEEVQATKTTGVIRGVVVNPAIVPLQGAVVTLVGPSGNATSLTTDETGTFAEDGLEPGPYAITVEKLGYLTAKSATIVVAGVDEPEIVRITLLPDAKTAPYATIIVFDGYIECASSVIVLCGLPNLLEPTVCGLSQGTVCYGNLTADRYTPTLYYDANATFLQTEMVWESTQAAFPDLWLQAETGDDLDRMGDAMGGSPLVLHWNATQLAGWGIGGDVGVYYSVFSHGPGTDIPPNPVLNGFLGVGVTLQQKIQLFSTSFYNFLPPEGWTFESTGEVPQPPA